MASLHRPFQLRRGSATVLWVMIGAIVLASLVVMAAWLIEPAPIAVTPQKDQFPQSGFNQDHQLGERAGCGMFFL